MQALRQFPGFGHVPSSSIGRSIEDRTIPIRSVSSAPEYDVQNRLRWQSRNDRSDRRGVCRSNLASETLVRG